MANLTGQPINTSYAGLIKTADNAGIDGTFKQLTDGLGTNIPIEVSNADLRILSNQIQLTDVAQVNGFSITDLTMAFGGAVDFSAATVTGLPGGGVTSIIAGTGISVDQATGDVTVSSTLTDTTYDLASAQDGLNVDITLTGSDATVDTVKLTAGTNITLTEAAGSITIDAAGGGGAAGLVAGTGTDSIASAITTTEAIASGTDTIALGDSAIASNVQAIAIGNGAVASDVYTVALGKGAQAVNDWNVAVGADAAAYSRYCTAIGGNAIAGELGSPSGGQDAIAIGNQPVANSIRSIAIGLDADALANDTIAIGARADATASGAIAIGSDTSSAVAPAATAVNAVALGNNVIANTADTVSVTALETQTDSTPTAGGIIMSDAGGTDRRINIDASGALQIDSTPVGGGGGSAGLVAGTGTSSMQSAASLTSIAADASGTNSISLGNNSTAFSPGNIAIGDGANCSAQSNGIAIGKGAFGYASNMIAIGENAYTGPSGYRNIAIGLNATTTVGTDCIAIGKGTSVTASNGCAIGEDSSATASGAVAIGNLITASKADTVSVKALETQTASTPTAGGIVMKDAGSTERRINIDASGALLIDSTPVGGGGGATAFSLPAFTIPTGAPAADTVYAVATIPANTFGNGDVLEFRSMEQRADLNNIVYESYFFSDTAQTAGSTVAAGTNFQQAGFQASDNGKLYYQKTLYIGATGTSVWNYGQTNDSYSSGVEGGDPIETQAIDWTVDQYFYFQAWNDNTTGTVQNYGTVLRKIN